MASLVHKREYSGTDAYKADSDWDDMLGPAGSPEGSRPGQFIGGDAVSEDVARDVLDLEIAAPGAPASTPYTEAEFAQGQSTDVLDVEDLEELSLSELKAAKAHVPSLVAPSATPVPAKALPGVAPMPATAKPAPAISKPASANAAAVATPEHTFAAVVDSPPPSKRSVLLYSAGALVLGAAGVLGAFVVLGDSKAKPLATESIAPVRAAATGGPVGEAPRADERNSARPADLDHRAGAHAAAEEVLEVAEEVEEEAAPAAGRLAVSSSPAGAQVYLDGDPIGETPLEREAVIGSHRLAVVLDGHALYESTISDGGEVEVELKATESFGGAGGIKVRCKHNARYRVFLDGVDTGALCPTDRLGVNLGEHVVEIYDLVTGERRSFDAEVKSTSRSLRLRVD